MRFLQVVLMIEVCVGGRAASRRTVSVYFPRIPEGGEAGTEGGLGIFSLMSCRTHQREVFLERLCPFDGGDFL